MQSSEVRFRSLTASDLLQARELASRVFMLPADHHKDALDSKSHSHLMLELLRREIIIGGVTPVPLESFQQISFADLLAIENISSSINPSLLGEANEEEEEREKEENAERS